MTTSRRDFLKTAGVAASAISLACLPTELDRSLWMEANYAGASFLTPDKIGKLQFASKIMNFVADRTQPAGLATVGYDDEGVPAQRWHLIKDGMFVDWQTTRDLAAMTGKKTSYGCNHADSWGSISFPRMPNVSLQSGPGSTDLDDLIAEVPKGILIYGDGSYSIDQQRYNFQFGGQVFWEIKDGKRGEMLRDVAYQSRTIDFWNSCDGLGGQSTYQLGGSFSDGKGDERINIYSDPWHPELPGSASAQSGLPAQKIVLVRNGVLQNLIYSRFWAKQKGKEPTPGPVNSIMESSQPPASMEDMIKSMDRGLLLGRFWYIRGVDPRTAMQTGLTRDGIWYIENGKIQYPVKNFRFNQSSMQLLAPGNVDMIGKPERAGSSEGPGGSAVLVPALKVKEFHFSSQSEAV